ncbi:hypothetical protein D3C81_1220290 [compost metagenome]
MVSRLLDPVLGRYGPDIVDDTLLPVRFIKSSIRQFGYDICNLNRLVIYGYSDAKSLAGNKIKGWSQIE